MKRLESTREEGQKPERFYGREHAMALPPGEIKAGRTCRYRLTVENRQGGKALREGVFYAKGGPQTFYVAPDGDDAGPGSADRPWKTLQHAVDRALPGETILLRPGIYDQPTVLRHGGAPGAPLVIRGEKKWEAILDANRGAAALLSLDNAPYVEMHDLQARWYQSVGIGLYKSPHVKVVGCKVWNDFWTGWPTGLAIRAHLSPDFTGERNVLFRQEHGFWMYFSPRVRLTNNTALSNLYSGACLLYSIQGSVVRNNDFAYNGNDNLVVEVMKGQKDHLKELDCDYNNLGTHLRQQPPGVKHDSVEPREKILSMGSKAIVRYSEWDSKEPTAKRFVSMEEWRQFGGQDRHSVFADPLHLCAQEQRFDLDPRSPNLGAGENGATLGAFPAAGGPAPQP
jgi:parallel beta-helix repeat protein